MENINFDLGFMPVYLKNSRKAEKEKLEDNELGYLGPDYENIGEKNFLEQICSNLEKKQVGPEENKESARDKKEILDEIMEDLKLQ